MVEPLTITIAHRTTRDAALARLRSNMARIRSEAAPFVGAIEERWYRDALDFRVAALGQTITGTIAVDESVYRIDIRLPALLAMFADQIASRVRERGTNLIGGPPA